MNTAQRRYFTQPNCLFPLGHRLLARFFAHFREDLIASSCRLPNPDVSNDGYFDALASVLETERNLPPRLAGALEQIEGLTADSARLERLVAMGPERIGFKTHATPLEQALLLWVSCVGDFSQVEQSSDPPPGHSKEGSNGESSGELAELTRSVGPNGLGQPGEGESGETAGLTAETAAPLRLAVGTSAELLDSLRETLRRFVILPQWSAEALALWVVHTYAFDLRDVTAYIGIESPLHRCGKTTLVTLLSELANRAVVASNVSSPALFRVIEELQPTLLIDEVDTFLGGNEEMRGILNAGCTKKTSFVYRVINQTREGRCATRSAESGMGVGGQPSSLARFSCWCPKVISRIGRLPETLADRCIVIRMQRKTTKEQCERLRNLKAAPLKEACVGFVAEHREQLARATPEIPPSLNDRAADIWEPLLIIADLAGSHWPETARRSAVLLSGGAEEQNPIGAFLADIVLLFTHNKTDRLFSRAMVEGLLSLGERPWSFWIRGKPLTELWLAQLLRPYGIRPKTLRIEGHKAKGYLEEDFMDTFRRYITRSDLDFITDHEGEDGAAGNGD